MNAYERQVVRATWATCASARDYIVERFYERLIELAPTMRLLLLDFDFGTHRRALLHAVDVAVANLERLERLGEYADASWHHATDPAAAALLWAIERALGPYVWTPSVAAAWNRCCALIAHSQRQPLRAPARVA
jgi:hemoglobin-like flavoprotein